MSGSFTWQAHIIPDCLQVVNTVAGLPLQAAIFVQIISIREAILETIFGKLRLHKHKSAGLER
jgi:hypothetical protein